MRQLRFGFLAAAVLLWLGAGAASPAQDGAEQAIQALIKGDVSKEDLESAKRQIEAAAAREPESNRWQFGRVLLLDALDQKLPARDLMAKVVEREPQSAEYQAWFGATIFEAIDETGMLSKLSWGLKGKAALEKAVELDPGHIRARMGLVQFYIEAPGLAGGSLSKAEEQANALLQVAEGRGEFQGRLALAQIAAQKKNWAEMDKQYTLSESAKGEGANAAGAMTRHALALLQLADEPAKALAVAERLAKVAKPDDVSPFFLQGEAHRKMGDCKTAVELFQKVLARKPEAQNSRFGIASCYEKLGDAAMAVTHYEEFAKRFPKDPRAPDATAAAKRLRKSG